MKSLYACGSNLLGHIIPSNVNNSAFNDFPHELQHELITEPHRLFANVTDARVLYAGLADVLLELTPPATLSPDGHPPPPILYLRGSTPVRLNLSTLPWKELTLPSYPPQGISHGFGTSTGEFLGLVLASHGGVWVLGGKDSGVGWIGGEGVWWEDVPRLDREDEKIEEDAKGRVVDISVAGNGVVAVVVEWGREQGERKGVQGKWRDINETKQPKWYTLQIYPSLDSLLPSPSSSPTFTSTPPPAPISTYRLPPSHTPTSLVSTLTSHALLLQSNPPNSSPPPQPNQSPTLPYASYPLILTTGDPRHPSLLLHSKGPTSSKPTQRPLLPLAPLEGLQDLIRLESDPGAWECAVVDAGGGVYLFGGRAGEGEEGLKAGIARAQGVREDAGGGVGEDVLLIEPPTGLGSLAGEEEEGEHGEGEEAEEQGSEKPSTSYEEDTPGIKDVALGSSHLLVLLDSGELFGIGRGKEGQLGCGGCSSSHGEKGIQRAREGWVRINFGSSRGKKVERQVKVERVWAGAWGSWMLVEEELDEEKEEEFEG